MKTIDNPKPEINPAKIGRAFHGVMSPSELIEKADQVEAMAYDESATTEDKAKCLGMSAAFRGLALEIYNICAPLNNVRHGRV